LVLTSDSDLDILNQLGVETQTPKVQACTPREERIIAGFEEIQRFVSKHGRTPKSGEAQDIFERLYATRLEQIRHLPECRELVADIDHQGLLNGEEIKPEIELDDGALLAELGVENETSDLTDLKHVRSS